MHDDPSPVPSRPPSRRPGLRARRLLAIGVLSLLPAACAVESTNTQARRDVVRQSQPPGSVYTGWRVFQDRCARCHGVDAAGGSGPDLRLRVFTMGPRRFVSLVLYRYDWSLPAGQAGASAAREALIDDILERRAATLAMPAWQDEPVVEAHIADLYAYLSARADGSQGPGRPAR